MSDRIDVDYENNTLCIESIKYSFPSNWVLRRMDSKDLKLIFANGNYAEKYPKKDEFVSEGIPFLRANNIKEGYISDEELIYITPEKHEELQRGHLKENDIIIAIRGNIGKSGIVPNVLDNANLNAQLSVVRVGDDTIIIPQYINYLFMSHILQRQFDIYTTGTALKQLSEKSLHSCIMPIPPLAEQKRIVEQIEILFSKLDEAREKAQEAVDSFDNVQSAILYDAFSGKLTESWRQKKNIDSSSWKEYTIQDVCSMKITDGTHKTPTYCEKDEGGYPFISSKDVTTKRICWDNIKYIVPELHDELYARLAPQKDDVLLAKNGTTGVAAIVEDDRVFDIYVTLAVLRPNKDIINPRYLLNIVNSPVCKKQFDEHLTGIGVPNLHLRDIKEVKINVPNLIEQEEVVRIVDTIIEKEQKAAETAEKTIEMIDLMKKSILAKAFRGELGTNIPEDESAIELLEKIFV